MTDQDLAIKEAGNQPGLTFKGYTIDYTKAVYQGTRDAVLQAKLNLEKACCAVNCVFATGWDHSGEEPVELWTMWI